MKQAQVAIFMVVGMLVLLLVGFFGFIVVKGPAQISSPAKSAKQFVTMCFSEASACTLYHAGMQETDIISDLVAIQETSQSSLESSARFCLGSNHFSQDLVFTRISPDVAFDEKTKITATHDIVVREDKQETTIEPYQETFDVPFKAMYAEAVGLKSGEKPVSVPESYIRLDSAFDVDVGEQDGKKLVSIVGGELKKQQYRFTFIK